MSGDIALVHLASGSLGPPPLARFVASYRRHPAGTAHELIVAFNGVATGAAAEPLEAELAGVAYTPVHVPRWKIDLAVYFELADRLEHDLLCFLNAGSELLADGWLAALRRHALAPGVGIVGATGSWESHGTMATAAGGRHDGRLGRARHALDRLRTLPERRAYRRRFPPWPNPHIRTNAFMIRRSLLLEVERGALASKADAHELESGRRGLTAQLRARGLDCLVVGRDGRGYRAREWPASRTFRSGSQENLLIGDNRTRDYDAAGADERAVLAAAAWGAP